MTALGRGLASLIPQRGKEGAEDLIEQIDTMEVVEEAPENVQRLRGRSSDVDGAKSSAVFDDESAAPQSTPTVKAAPNTTPLTEARAKKQLNVVEEADDGSEPLTPPSRPLVTPLTIDPEPTDDDARFLGEDDQESTAQQETTVAVSAEQAEVVEAVADDMPEVVAEANDDAGHEVPERPPLIKSHIVRAPKPVSADQAPEPEPEVEDTGEEHEEVEEETPAPRLKVSILDKPSADEKMAARKAASREVAKSLRHDDRLGKNVEQIALGDIEVNPLQPRRKFDKEELDELMHSIDQHGILQPLVVMEKEDGAGYQIVAGERRFRAAKQLGLEKVPCVVRKGVSGDRNRLELALTENVQRQNLNPIEEAMGYKQLHDEYGMSHEEIAKRVGRSRVTITNIMRILQLPAEIQRGLMDELITPGHAKAILMIPDPEKQLRFYQHILEEGLTVRKSEIRARNIYRSMNINDPARERNRGRPQLALKYDGVLQDHFGYTARVKFNQVKNRFEVVFHAFSEDEAKNLLETLLGNRPLPENVDQDVRED